MSENADGKIGQAADNPSTSGPAEHNRRDVVKAIGRYSAFIGTSSYVVLSADDALAKRPCSQHPRPRPGQNCDP